MPASRNQPVRHPIADARGLADVKAAAVRLFAERGFGETSMKDVAEALGVRAPSLYNYVNSKREILDALCLEAMEGMRAALAEGVALSGDVVEQVRRGMEEQVRFRVRHPYHLQVVTRETLHLDPDVRTRVLDLRDEQREMWRQVVERGVETGRFTAPSSELASQLLLEMCSWLQIMHFSLKLGVPETRLVYWFGDVAVRMLTESPS